MPIFEETNGIQTQNGIKAVIYGQEGVGKTSLAARFPGAVFIDCEGSTGRMNVRRLPKPTSWQMLKDEVDFILHSHAERGYQTVVIDTFDWAERLALDELCAEHNVTGIEGFGYGKGWEYEKEKVGHFLDRTEDLIAAGINVVFLCHAVTKKTTLPEEMEEYDHWELKLGNKTTNKIAPLLKEWSDMTLFLAFRTNIIATDKEGKKHKATGTERVMYTTKTAWWDAKNRFGLPERLPLNYDEIAYLFAPATVSNMETVQQPAQNAVPTQSHVRDVIDKALREGITVKPEENLADFVEIPANDPPTPAVSEAGTSTPQTVPIPDGIPTALADLMREHNVQAKHLEFISSGVWTYFPAGMPLAEFPADYHQWLAANWGAVLDTVKANCKDYVPF